VANNYRINPLTRISHQAAWNTEQGIGPFEKNQDDQKYSVLFEHAYRGSGWSSCP
jgi:hypothetical protein